MAVWSYPGTPAAFLSSICFSARAVSGSTMPRTWSDEPNELSMRFEWFHGPSAEPKLIYDARA